MFIINHWQLFLLAAVWTVYKFQHYIPSGRDVDLGDSGEYNSYNEARLKTYRKVSNEYPVKDVSIFDGKHDDGQPFFLISVVVGICEFLFVPFKK